MGHTNDEERDFEGFEFNYILKDEESDVNLNNESVLRQFDFFFNFLFFLYCVCDFTTKKLYYYCTTMFEGYFQQCFN